MLDLTILDYIYGGVIIASTVWATFRGGVFETIATLSWVVAAISARFASPWLDALLQTWFGLSESTVGTLVASYFIVFFAVLLLVGFVNQKLRDKIQDSIMNATSKTPKRVGTNVATMVGEFTHASDYANYCGKTRRMVFPRS